MRYTKQELNSLETIEQAWDGDELKIKTPNLRVWLTHEENRRWDADYSVEIRDEESGRWEQTYYFF